MCKDKNVKTFLGELRNADRTQFVILLYENWGIKNTIDYRILVQDFTDNQSRLNWLLTQTKPPLELNLKADETPIFTTTVQLPEEKIDVTSSSKVTYSLFHNDEKEPELKKTYKKYTQSRFLPTIGLAYIPESRTGTIFDNATGQFTPDKQFDNIEALVGVKYYPSFFVKTNPVRHLATRRLIQNSIGREANYSRGNAFENTFFITGGLGVRQQFLRNYYLGAGFDLFPGVNLHAGWNFIFEKRYQLQNAKILNEQERPRGYVYFSISLDPGIVASLTRIFL